MPGGSLTKGVVDARWSVSAWDMTEGTNSAGVTWKLRGVGGSKDEVSIRFDQNGAGSNNDRVRVRSIDSENTGKQKTWAAGSLVSTTFGVDFRVVLDLDNATMEAYWKETADEDWTLIDAALSNGLTQLDDIWLVSTATTNAGYCDFDYFVVDHFVEPTVDPETPAEWYSQWLDDYPSLTLVELDDDEDADGADNLYEYATGGDPEDGNVTGIAHELSAVPGYLQVIHVQRSDADVRGLSYVLKTSTDLVHGSFTESGYVITGTNDNYEVEGFDAVTNLVPTDVYNAQFIKLEVGFTPGE